MKLSEVTIEHREKIKARYLKVLETMEEEASKVIIERASKEYGALLERLKEVSNHEPKYLAYVLTRRFQTYNIPHLLDHPKVGSLNLPFLENLIRVWESTPQCKLIFAATDSLDIPYAFLRQLLDSGLECKSCSKNVPFMELLYNSAPQCSCGEDLNALSGEDLLPFGLSHKIQRKSSRRKRMVI